MAVLVAAACASTDDELAAARDSWHGATYDQVVQGWGTPVRQTTLTDGSHVYTWVTEASGGYYPGSYGSVGVAGGSGGGRVAGIGISMPLPGFGMGGGGGELVRCERTLTFREGRVAEQLWQGDPRLCSTLGKV